MPFPIPSTLPKSPTATLAWLKCREYWRLAKTEKPSKEVLDRLRLGRAGAHLLATYFQKKDINPIIHQNFALEPKLKTLADLLPLVVIHLKQFGPIQWVEKRIEECRPDMVLGRGEMRAGRLLNLPTIIDFKITAECSEEDLVEQASTFENKWQLMHYAWRVSLLKQIQEVRVGVIYITLAPIPTLTTVAWYKDGLDISQWLTHATQVWMDMEREKNNIFKNITSCVSHRGKCSYYQRCHEEGHTLRVT